MRKESQIRTTINNISKKQATLREAIHDAAIEVAGHAQQHGRATLAQELFLAVRGQDRHALASWFKLYTPVRLDAEGKATLSKAARKGFDGDGDDMVAYLKENATPWFELVKDMGGVARDIDPAGSILALAKKINKAPEKGVDVKLDREALETALRELQLALENARRAQAEPLGALETVDGALARELKMAA